MAAGKNKLVWNSRLYVGGYDLSGDTRTVGGLGLGQGEVDMTGWGQSPKWFMADGNNEYYVKGYEAFLNDATGQSWAQLKTAATVNLSLYIGDNGAAPAVGNIAYLLPAVSFGPNVNLDKVGKFTADFYPDYNKVSANYQNPCGLVLLPLTALSSTNTGAAVDLATAGTVGGSAILHVLVSSGGVWQFKVQGSDDGLAGWGDLITFTANGGSVTSEFNSCAGAVNRYVRALSTRTSGTCSAAIAFAKNN